MRKKSLTPEEKRMLANQIRKTAADNAIHLLKHTPDERLLEGLNLMFTTNLYGQKYSGEKVISISTDDIIENEMTDELD
jgi:hypothetical protein